MALRKRISSITTVFGLAIASLTLTSPPAYTASYNGACSSGYNVIDSISVSNGNGTVYT